MYSLVDVYASSSFRGSLVHAPDQSVKVSVHSDEGLFSCRLHLLVHDEASSVVTLGMDWFGSYMRWAGTSKGVYFVFVSPPSSFYKANFTCFRK